MPAPRLPLRQPNEGPHDRVVRITAEQLRSLGAHVGIDTSAIGGEGWSGDGLDMEASVSVADTESPAHSCVQLLLARVCRLVSMWRKFSAHHVPTDGETRRAYEALAQSAEKLQKLLGGLSPLVLRNLDLDFEAIGRHLVALQSACATRTAEIDQGAGEQPTPRQVWLWYVTDAFDELVSAGDLPVFGRAGHRLEFVRVLADIAGIGDLPGRFEDKSLAALLRPLRSVGESQPSSRDDS